MYEPSRLSGENPTPHAQPSALVTVLLSCAALVFGVLSPAASLLRLVAVTGLVATFAFYFLKVPGFPFWTMLSIGTFVLVVGLLVDAIRHALNDVLAERDQNSRN